MSARNPMRQNSRTLNRLILRSCARRGSSRVGVPMGWRPRRLKSTTGGTPGCSEFHASEPQNCRICSAAAVIPGCAFPGLGRGASYNGPVVGRPFGHSSVRTDAFQTELRRPRRIRLGPGRAGVLNFRDYAGRSTAEAQRSSCTRTCFRSAAAKV